MQASTISLILQRIPDRTNITGGLLKRMEKSILKNLTRGNSFADHFKRKRTDAKVGWHFCAVTFNNKRVALGVTFGMAEKLRSCDHDIMKCNHCQHTDARCSGQS